MPVVSLTSFLNLLGKSSPQKIREYRKYLSPGGYDYYWQLKDAASNLTIGGQPFEQCLIPLRKIKRESERKHNIARFESLHTWLSRAECTFFRPPRGSCSSPKGHLKIRLEPEFGMVVRGQRKLVHLWSNQGQALKTSIAGAGIYLMNAYLANGEFVDCSNVILDLKKLNAFASDSMPAYVPAMVSSELSWVDSFFEVTAKAA